MSIRAIRLCLIPVLLWSGLAAAQEINDGERHYDARAGASRALTLDQSRAQTQTPQGLNADVQELSALEVDELTGAVRSLGSERVGHYCVLNGGRGVGLQADASSSRASPLRTNFS